MTVGTEVDRSGSIQRVWEINHKETPVFMKKIREYQFFDQFGGMEVSDAKRLKTLEKENNELKKVVAELTLDNRMLKDVLTKKW